MTQSNSLESIAQLSPRTLRVNAIAWALITTGLGLQYLLLRALERNPEPLWPAIFWRLALLPVWAAATPWMIRSAARWPIGQGGGWRAVARHLTHAVGFVVVTNVGVRAAWSLFQQGEDWETFARGVSRGITVYGPWALLAYAAILGIGSILAGPSQAQSSPAATDPASHATPASCLTLRDQTGTRLVPVAEIGWLQADDNYVEIGAGQEVHRIRGRLSELGATLDPERFLRIHRSAIVALAWVRTVSPVSHGDLEVSLADGTRHRVARARRKALETALQGLSGDLRTRGDLPDGTR